MIPDYTKPRSKNAYARCQVCGDKIHPDETHCVKDAWRKHK